MAKKSESNGAAIANHVVELTVPIGECPEGYVQKHVDMQLTERQGRALKIMTAGLDKKDEAFRVIRRTRPVQGADTIKHLLDDVADLLGI